VPQLCHALALRAAQRAAALRLQLRWRRAPERFERHAAPRLPLPRRAAAAGSSFDLPRARAFVLNKLRHMSSHLRLSPVARRIEVNAEPG